MPTREILNSRPHESHNALEVTRLSPLELNYFFLPFF